MYLQIITPEKSVFDEEVDEVLAPTEKGEIGILPHHISLVTNLVPGELTIKQKGKEKAIAVTGGFLEVAHDKVTILADYAEHADKIDTQKAQEAQKRAEQILSKKPEDLNEHDIIMAQAELRRALLQQHIAQRHRRKSS